MKGEKILQEEKRSVLESKINGCQVMLHFVPQSIDGVIENVQSILSNAYDERVQKELKALIENKHLVSDNGR